MYMSERVSERERERERERDTCACTCLGTWGCDGCGSETRSVKRHGRGDLCVKVIGAAPICPYSTKDTSKHEGPSLGMQTLSYVGSNPQRCFPTAGVRKLQRLAVSKLDAALPPKALRATIV